MGVVLLGREAEREREREDGSLAQAVGSAIMNKPARSCKRLRVRCTKMPARLSGSVSNGDAFVCVCFQSICTSDR